MSEIKISIGDHGQMGVAVSNDISNALPLVIGFLELAKVALIEQAKQNQNRVQPVSLMPPGLGGN